MDKVQYPILESGTLPNGTKWTKHIEPPKPRYRCRTAVYTHTAKDGTKSRTEVTLLGDLLLD